VKVVTYSAEEDKRILYAMIMDDMVLGRISSYWKEPMFAQKLGDTVGRMCVDFYNTSHKAPKQGIADLVRDYGASRPHMTEEELTGLERLTGALLSTPQEGNAEVTIFQQEQDQGCYH
jgi:hypothetical protein